MWIVCWRIRDKIGNGKPVDKDIATDFVRLGNKVWGEGTHWMGRIIEGGAEPLNEQQP